GIAAFDRLVWQVMTKEPYASARTVYWIVDNGSSHRGQASIERLEGRWRNLRLIHLPVHASWLNQVEIYVRHEAPCERRERGTTLNRAG
ncbi:MAG: transposase, partial [Actinobacteria bacterium]|nr:transposase [Actinomycetota bacterium]